jgi:hypothetical protein
MVTRTTISDAALSPWRYRWNRAITIRSQMAFVVKFDTSEPLRIRLGPQGSELSCYVPSGVPWKQINYGQSEGQVEIDGREWGFYWQGPREFAVILHDGEIDVSEALQFVRAVAEKVSSGQVSFKILLAGDSHQDS